MTFRTYRARTVHGVRNDTEPPGRFRLVLPSGPCFSEEKEICEWVVCRPDSKTCGFEEAAKGKAERLPAMENLARANRNYPRGAGNVDPERVD